LFHALFTPFTQERAQYADVAAIVNDSGGFPIMAVRDPNGGDGCRIRGVWAIIEILLEQLVSHVGI
jgi:hypothetical protein